MKVERIAIGVVPEDGQAAAAMSDAILQNLAHMAIHRILPGAINCSVRVLWLSARWKWEAVLRETGADPEQIERLSAQWEPGKPVALGIFDAEVGPEHPRFVH